MGGNEGVGMRGMVDIEENTWNQFIDTIEDWSKVFAHHPLPLAASGMEHGFRCALTGSYRIFLSTVTEKCATRTN